MIEIYYSTNKNPVLEKIAKSKAGCWIHVVDPSPDELQQLADDHGLEHDLLVDATDIYETPRIEREDGNTYVFARYCYPQGRDIATEPMLIVYAQQKLITILRSKTTILERLLNNIEPVATTQKTKTFLQILGAINYSYDRNMHKVNKQLLGLRSKLSKADIRNEYFIEFIDIEENLNEYLTALQPQAVMLRNLLNGRFLTLYEEDKDMVEDLSLNTTELIDLIKSRVKTISNIRDAYSTIMANTLNSTFRRLTSISIFLMIPAITAALYGMNLRLPLATNANAFWYILAIVMALTTLCIWLFRKLKWL
jgi:magnesium transporter